MKNHIQQAESLLGKFKPVDVDCVYTLSHLLCHQDTDIILAKNNVYTTIRQIYNGTAYSMPADRIQIKFYGGPIGHGTWFAGTLYTYLLDIIACKIQIEGFEYTRRLLRGKS